MDAGDESAAVRLDRAEMHSACATYASGRRLAARQIETEEYVTMAISKDLLDILACPKCKGGCTLPTRRTA